MREPLWHCSLFLTLILLSANLFADQRVVDARGKTLTFSSPPKRIVSLIPAGTEILFAVGAGDTVVGDTEYCNYPEAARRVTKIGGFSGKAVNIESIVMLNPDLVVASFEMHQKVMSLLELAGVRCLAMEPHSIADVVSSIRLVGSISGHTQEAEAVVSLMESRIEAVKRRVVSLPKAKVFWEIWHDPLMTAGGATFITETLDAAGGQNVFDDLSEAWPLVGFEDLLIRSPDWVLSSDENGAYVNLEALQRRPGWKALRAVREGHVALVDGDIISRGGPRLADAIEALAAILHPEE